MPLRLDLGAGNVKTEGFISVDLYDPQADVRADITDLPYPDDSVDEIVCYQVIEHVPYQKSEAVFKEIHRVLKVGGQATIETVDMDVIARRLLSDEGLSDNVIHNIYGQYYRPWDKDRYPDWENNAASIHRNPWNMRRVLKYAEQFGFSVVQNDMIDKHDNYKYEENLSVRLTKN